jgi:dTDP-4-amino-4,6-dideoxygalactose transaminase
MRRPLEEAGTRRDDWLDISRPSLPPPDAFLPLVEEILTTRRTSNGGPFSERLEEAMADYLGVTHVVGAPSGDTALGMAMLAVREMRPDRDEVVLPSYTFPSTASAVIRAGLRPRFCDVDPSTLCVTPETVAPHLSTRTAAVVPVHAHGHPCDMTSLSEPARDVGATVVSDAASALGAEWDGRRIGGFGDLEVFSLSSTKVLTAGEGGFLACDDAELANLLRRIGRYGLDEAYRAGTIGVNGRMAELPAALALASLPSLEGWVSHRRVAAERYVALVDAVPGVRIPAPTDVRATSAWKDVPLVLETPELTERLAERLAAHRVQTRPYYRPLHLMPAFATFASTDLEVTGRLDERVLCVPIFNDIDIDDVEFVAACVRDEVASGG